MNTIVNIGNRRIGDGQPCFVIAEVAQAHDGSLGMAHAYIDAVAKTGADAVKFQTHIADEESTPHEPWRVKFSYQDELRFDYWKRMEFTLEQWLGLKQHAEDKGLIFLSSPFSTKAVEWLERCGVPMWKIASGEINNYLLYEVIAKTRKPVILSSGMSGLEEIKTSVDYFMKKEIPYMMLQCTTEYPCPPNKIGLNYIQQFKEQFACPVGLSDHSGDIFASLAAVAIGANLIEVHVTMSKDMFGPDVSSSLTVESLTQLVGGIRQTEVMMRSPMDKDALAKEKEGYRSIFGKALMADREIRKGEVITSSMLTAKKPMMGISVTELNNVIGKKALMDIPKGDFLTYEKIGD